MKPRPLLAAAVGGIALALTGCAAIDARPDPYLDGFAAAERQGRTFTPVTELDSATTMDRAYDLQRRIVAARAAAGDRAIGFKGGLMSAKSLADRHVEEPLTGVLFASGDTAAGGVVSLCGYRRPAFEMKLGYTFRTAVTAAVKSTAELKTLVAQVQPVVELPDIAYRDDKTYGAVDMAAANISSAKFVRGAPSVAFDGLDALSVTMRRGDARVTTGLGRESLGDQWESLRTVVNLALAHGGRIDAGSLVLTGKIGDKGDIAPGAYTADYGPLGLVQFRVENCPTS